MTRFAGIIGYPLGHSISPAFQQAAFDALGLDCSYERWPTSPDELEDRFRSLRNADVLGANVTVPHKQAVLALVDEIDLVALRIGAINTVVRHDTGRLSGHNTDAAGFIRSLELDATFDPQGARVAIIGAGGAARAVGFALADAGAARITILNRTEAAARNLAESLTAASTVDVDTALLVEKGGAGPQGRTIDLIVQCTSLGMRGGPDELRAPEVSDMISPRTLVCDLVYNPVETPLLRLAKEHGAPTLGGLGMLVHQGAAAFAMWTGSEAPIDVMERAALQALER